MEAKIPADWKTYDDFAAGIATNRLPPSTDLLGHTLVVQLAERVLRLHFDGPQQVLLSDTLHGEGHETREWCETVAVAPCTYFVDITFGQRPRQATTLIANTRSRRVLLVESEIRSAEQAGAEPQVAQTFLVGRLQGGELGGCEPHESRELIGLRTWQTYSPHHTYEHTYLNAQRYCWQCLVGVQRGQGDVDMASYYKFDEDQYLFSFREFLIPVASVFFFNFSTGRSTGKFLGLGATGEVANRPAGALMQKASLTAYPPHIQPL